MHHARGRAKGRIIPACAGNSDHARAPDTHPADHPRVCGELRNSPPPWSLARGSSPRVRGTPALCARLHRQARIIPACAGNSPSSRASRGGRPDHPRVCGELLRMESVAIGSSGSSPRVRGTRIDVSAQTLRDRVIPACAGNSCRATSTRRGSSDHPRVCGELPVMILPSGIVSGSSPRVRGTPLHEPGHHVGRRIIPACAGNSKSV